MSLPQLPKPVYFGNEVFAYDTEQMQAYGQTCREQALEEAAMAAGNGFKYALDGYQIADNIRRLKP